MTATEVTDEPAARRTGRELAGAAVLIGVITILARVAGFGRIVVFSQTVKTSCLGQAYYTANQIPNIVFEIVAGGALAVDREYLVREGQAPVEAASARVQSRR